MRVGAELVFALAAGFVPVTFAGLFVTLIGAGGGDAAAGGSGMVLGGIGSGSTVSWGATIKGSGAATVETSGSAAAVVPAGSSSGSSAGATGLATFVTSAVASLDTSAVSITVTGLGSFFFIQLGAEAALVLLVVLAVKAATLAARGFGTWRLAVSSAPKDDFRVCFSKRPMRFATEARGRSSGRGIRALALLSEVTGLQGTEASSIDRPIL